MENVNELWVVPFNAKLIAVMDSKWKLYSSNRLRYKFVKMLQKNPITQPCKYKLADLVFKDIITPCYSQKGFLDFAKFKLFGGEVGGEGIAGFMNPRTSSIYVVCSMGSNFFGFTSNDMLSYTTIHECMHLLCHQNPNKFWSLFEDDIVEYYDNIYKPLLGIEAGVDFSSKPIAEYVYNKFEKPGKNPSKDSINKFGKLLTDLAVTKSYLTEGDLNTLVERIQFIIIATAYKPEAIDSMYNRKEYQNIFTKMYNAYNKVFGIRNAYKYTYAYQEFSIPSEIICVATSKPKQSFYTGINSLRA